MRDGVVDVVRELGVVGIALLMFAEKLFRPCSSTQAQSRAWVEEHGTWLAMTPADVGCAVEWFHGHGRYSVLLGRLMPVVRTLVSVPAGFSRMPLLRFLALSAVGTLIWTEALAHVGRFLGRRFAAVEQIVGPSPGR